MGVNLKRKRGSSAMEVVMVMVALVLLINTNSCGASFLLKSNVTSYRQCISTGAMDGCLIADDLDLEFDFFMDTHVVRFLDESEQKQAGGRGGGTSGAEIPDRAVCHPKLDDPNHPDGLPYNCDPRAEHITTKCGSRYNRSCWSLV